MSKYTVAIDLGCSDIVVAVGTKDSDGKLNVVDVALKPLSDGVVKGEISNIENITKALRTTLSDTEHRLGITIDEVYASLSGQHIQSATSSYFVYVGSDGEVKEEDVRKLKENMDNVQPPEDSMVIMERIPQSYTIDNHEQTSSPIGRFGRQLGATFNFIVANKNSIERNQKVFDRVGVRRKGIFAAPIASSVAVATEDEKELGVMVVDLGAGTTSVCIWHYNVLRHVAVIPMGMNTINKDIRSASIPDLHIEDLKVAHGYAVASTIPNDLINKTINIPGRTKHEVKQITFRDLSTIIEARVMDIIEYVIGEIKDSGMSEKLASGIVLTGGGSQLKGIDKLFEERTGYDVRLASADFNINDQSKELVSDPRLATAAGVLLLAQDSNLLSAQSQQSGGNDVVYTSRPTQQPLENKTPDFSDDTDFIDDEEFEETTHKSKRKSRKKEKAAKQNNNGEESGLKSKVNKFFTSWFGVVDDDDESIN